MLPLWMRSGFGGAGGDMAHGVGGGVGPVRWRRAARRYAFPALGFMAVIVLFTWVQNLESLMHRPSVSGLASSEELLRRGPK